MAIDTYPDLPLACVILDAGYDAQELLRDIYTELNLLPIIIRKPSMKWGSMMSKTGTPLCRFGWMTIGEKGQLCQAQESIDGLKNFATTSNVTMSHQGEPISHGSKQHLYGP